MQFSGQSLEWTDPQTGKKLVPHVIEPAVGVTRMFLMALADAYTEDEENGRVVLKLAPALAPYKVAVFPLLGNKPELIEKAKALYDGLKTQFVCVWDDRGNIGKRYAYQDEVGTPYCVTVDFDSLTDESVTVRDRDTGEQQRLGIDKLPEFLSKRLM